MIELPKHFSSLSLILFFTIYLCIYAYNLPFPIFIHSVFYASAHFCHPLFLLSSFLLFFYSFLSDQRGVRICFRIRLLPVDCHCDCCWIELSWLTPWNTGILLEECPNVFATYPCKSKGSFLRQLCYLLSTPLRDDVFYWPCTGSNQRLLLAMYRSDHSCLVRVLQLQRFQSNFCLLSACIIHFSSMPYVLFFCLFLFWLGW